MPSFNTLPEAQAHARANGLFRYFRVHFTDATTRELRGRGGWWTDSRPAFRFYTSLAETMDCVAKHVNSPNGGRCEVEMLYTDEVSDSPQAR